MLWIGVECLKREGKLTSYSTVRFLAIWYDFFSRAGLHGLWKIVPLVNSSYWFLVSTECFHVYDSVFELCLLLLLTKWIFTHFIELNPQRKKKKPLTQAFANIVMQVYENCTIRLFLFITQTNFECVMKQCSGVLFPMKSMIDTTWHYF